MYLGIDPGGTTGWALIDDGGSLLEHGEDSYVEFMSGVSKLYKILEQDPRVQYIVIERFVPMQFTDNRALAVINLVVQTAKSRSKEAIVMYQNAGQRKLYPTTPGWKMRDHETSAWQHAQVFRVRFSYGSKASLTLS